jgi:hypothetical protein
MYFCSDRAICSLNGRIGQKARICQEIGLFGRKDGEFDAFMMLLRDADESAGAVLGLCLMPNHFYLALSPRDASNTGNGHRFSHNDELSPCWLRNSPQARSLWLRCGGIARRVRADAVANDALSNILRVGDGDGNS